MKVIPPAEVECDRFRVSNEVEIIPRAYDLEIIYFFYNTIFIMQWYTNLIHRAHLKHKRST